jgi:hypothetical protein
MSNSENSTNFLELEPFQTRRKKNKSLLKKFLLKFHTFFHCAPSAPWIDCYVKLMAGTTTLILVMIS